MTATARCILLNQEDNTLTALEDIDKGSKVCMQVSCEVEVIVLTDNIPFGHKFARQRIPKGGDVIKYGELIGRATLDIEPGGHVHTHNVRSTRMEAASQ